MSLLDVLLLIALLPVLAIVIGMFIRAVIVYVLTVEWDSYGVAAVILLTVAVVVIVVLLLYVLHLLSML